MVTGRKPYKKLRNHNIFVTLWENLSQKGEPYLSASVYLSYKNSEGEWKEKKSLFLSDLCQLIPLALQAANEMAQYQKAELPPVIEAMLDILPSVDNGQTLIPLDKVKKKTERKERQEFDDPLDALTEFDTENDEGDL